MAPITNERVIFAKVPKGEPVPGEHLVVDKSETIDLDAELKPGEILVKTLVLSLDPYLRGKMREASKASYTPAFELNKPIVNFGADVSPFGEGRAAR
jgi:NADPH-dependent curcumin reductase CurA